MDQQFIKLTCEHDNLADEHSRVIDRYDNLLAKYDELAAKSGELAAQHFELAGKHDELSAKHNDLDAKYNKLATRARGLEKQVVPHTIHTINKRCKLSEIPPFGQLRLDTNSERHSVWMALGGSTDCDKETVTYSEVLIPGANITGLTRSYAPDEIVLLKMKFRTELGEKNQKWWSLGVSTDHTQSDRIPFGQKEARELLGTLGPQYSALAPPSTYFKGEEVERAYPSPSKRLKQ